MTWNRSSRDVKDMDTDILTLIDKLSGAGLATLLIVILYGGFKRLWVWGYQLEEMRIDRDRWQQLALKGTALSERTLNLVVDK